ncbi:RNA polymerase III-inhibiting protein maf1 [Xanthoria calcicola]
MKYLPIQEFEDVTNALNFDTADSHIIGGCDLYTTKTAGADKNLYKVIEDGLEAQHQTQVAISKTLPETHAGPPNQRIDLSRSSPFGPLSQHTARRTFAYLIATLNASHPDYDFSHLLRPSDFRREKSLRHVMNTLDTTLYSLRPRPTSNASLGIPTYWTSIAASAPAVVASNGESWNPRKWRLIDKEMSLKDCSIYAYVPDEDPYDGDEGAIWSFNYFFFNKARKRVCYLYLKSLSIISHSAALKTPIKEKRIADIGWGGSEPGSSKRAKYWLGDREDISGAWHEDDDDEEYDEDHVASTWHKERMYAPGEMPRHGRHSGLAARSRATETLSPSLSASSGASRKSRSRSKSRVRDMNEDIAESIDV